MKRNLYYLILLLTLLILFKPINNAESSNFIITLNASDTFISKWNTTLTSSGSSASNQIKLPLLSIGSYNFIVDWGDGNSDTIISWNQAEVTHTYTSGGIYNLKISGTLIGWMFNNGGDKLKIIEISQWGSLNFGNFGGYFFGASNLVLTANDVPDLTGTTSLSNAFRSANNLGSNGNIKNWDVSNVINMASMFSGATSFNEPIGNWNVSSVTKMAFMFSEASSFNQDIGNWDVSSVSNMIFMFDRATSFNQPLNNWDISSLTGTSFLFTKATSFNQPLNNWDVSGVFNMQGMFFGASSFNQDIGNWDVSSVFNMQGMFSGASSFNQPLNNWDVSNLVIMSSMFSGASSFNQYIGNWDVSSVSNMQGMFSGASSFNQEIRNWNISSAVFMSSMFQEASSFNQYIGDWDVSSVSNMQGMFSGASSFNQYIGNWDVSSVSNMQGMFSGASSFNQPLNNWNVFNAIDMSSMFQKASLFNQPLNNWNVKRVTNMHLMFSEASSFNQSIGNWDVSSVTYMSSMFYNASLFNQPLNNWDVSNLVIMSSMFSGASSFNQPLNNWDVSNVINMYQMFYGVELTINNYNNLLSNWSKLSLQNNVNFDGGNSRYTNSTARQYIIDNFSWTITDGGLNDSISPQLNSPTDISYELGSTGNKIIWTINDLNPGIYNVTLNGSIYISNKSWTNDIITVNIDKLDIGSYTLNINVYDDQGNMASDTVEITVIDTTDPIINELADILYEEGSTGNEIIWNVGDINPGAYKVTLNGSLYISNTSWTNGTINVNIDGLSTGVYILIINLYDKSVNIASDEIIISVVDFLPTTPAAKEKAMIVLQFTSGFFIYTIAIISVLSAIAIIRLRKKINKLQKKINDPQINKNKPKGKNK